MSEPLYQFLIFGQPSLQQVSTLKQTISSSMAEFSLLPNKNYSITKSYGSGFLEEVPSVALFFGGINTSFTEYSNLIRLNIPIVPLVSNVKNVSKELPECLRSINAMALETADTNLIKPANAALECLGLLPKQRRVFISYFRDESSDVAVQIFETLSSRQFDVFLDTHSVGVATDFQSVLWHRLCDCDVVIMLDTPRFFERRWTRLEWGRAIDKNIAILQLLWPGHTPSRYSELATRHFLTVGNFANGKLTKAAIEEIALEVEELRSKSVALRYANIAGHLRSSIELMGGSIEGFGTRRSLVMKSPSGGSFVAHLSVGVPTAMTLHEVVRDCDPRRTTILVYDHVGLSGEWKTHLDWLGTNFTRVKWIKSRQAGWELTELEDF